MNAVAACAGQGLQQVDLFAVERVEARPCGPTPRTAITSPFTRQGK